jgi:hypothetical protein
MADGHDGALHQSVSNLHLESMVRQELGLRQSGGRRAGSQGG